MLRGFRTHVVQHDWFAVGVDLVVVVVGILVALEFGSWVEARKDRALEQVYLERLKEDFEIELARIDDARRYAQSRIDAAKLLHRLVADPASAPDAGARVPWAVETASWRSFPQINAFVYGELQSTGRLALLRSVSLRRMLAEHYTASHHEARVGLDLSAQQRFDAACSGLLGIDELTAIELAGGRWEKLEVTPARALEIAREFARRPAAIAELPSLVQHHTYNLRVLDDMRRRIEAIIARVSAPQVR
ncbi:MAG TPA: DUF6090 family protein [Xanthomonadales bacterium]|nr:DUF6090 family protein [Xanthomonadales bacterium]